MKYILYTLILLVSINFIQAQGISDVARWSYTEPGGTARTFGVGGAFGAMGGDYSIININPAGIADYRKSEFTLSPSIRYTKTRGNFVAAPDNSLSIVKSNLGIENLGLVFASNPSSTWTSSNFVLGYSRILDLNRNFNIQGKTPGSITTYFAEKANSIQPDDLDEFIAYPAYNTGAIYDLEKDNFYESDFTSPTQLVEREQNIIQKGGINELAFGWAGEYDKRVNVGFTVGVPIYSFEENKLYTERDSKDEIPVFDRLTYDEILSTNGVGINVKGGVVFKVKNRLRVGASFHSPTWARFTDNFNTAMNYQYNDGNPNSFSYTSKDGVFEYKITTPWKAIGSIGSTFVSGDLVGFVNADIEFVDYTNASYDGTAFSNDPSEVVYTNEVNRDVQRKLGAATNARLGVELGYKQLRLRGGYGIERTPFIADDFYNNRVAFGIGYRDDKFFFDLGVRMSQFSEGYNPYVVLDSKLDPLANINTDRVKTVATFGFKF
jgi:hypothetical protein